jgi:predicted enzyme related to lactoylglutathione lyase
MSRHPIVHIEFSALDQQQSGKFYEDLFGWQIQHMPEFNYTTFRTGEADNDLGGGINKASDEYPTGTIVFYVGTDDIEATLARAESLGGKTILPKMEVTGMGWMAMFLDPSGNKIGLWTTAPMNGNS